MPRRVASPIRLALLGSILLPNARASAQTPEAGAYLARIHTPGGAIAPLSIGIIDGGDGIGAGLHASFAMIGRPPFTFAADQSAGDRHEQVYALSGDLPLARAGRLSSTRVSASVGTIIAPCDAGPDAGGLCDPGFLWGIGLTGALGRAHTWTSLRGAPTFAAGFALDVGAGRQQTRAWAAGAGVPLKLSFRIRRQTWATESDPRYQPRTVIFFQPAIARGELRAGDDPVAARTFAELSFGASVVDVGPGVGVTFGARKHLVDGSRLQGSIAFSWHARRAPAGGR